MKKTGNTPKEPKKRKKLSAEHRAAIASSLKGRIVSEETRARLAEALKGKKRPPEVIAKMRAANIGKKHSEETRRKMSESHTGVKRPPEVGIKVAKALKGRPKSEEHKTKLAEANTGKHPTEETRAKLRAAHKGHKHTEETKAKIGAAHLGMQHTEESKEKNRQAHLGRTHAVNIEAVIALSKRQESNEERELQTILKRLGLFFEPHYPLLNRYVVDVFLPQFNLILEVDGYWHTVESVKVRDVVRDQNLQKAGYKIIRIPANAVAKRPVQQIIRKVRLSIEPQPQN